ncbi:hypothetical protein ASD64_11000 [Mesorhizobium sp. Root157]|uniref:L,D-transpeptidase family protein n=1 Tax=Mesorhizobium sp. Root157 TaxID=1736477 RepID=UPI0006F26A35|nr:L,D-transpeptidase [Mesorhizobium sp. Root157]KQZ80821.1 hypothetical protein ASD64_11000 [Mesorhizobium sp. Root157]
MLRMIFSLSAVAAALFSTCAAASQNVSDQHNDRPAEAGAIVVAQNGDYEVYYDGRGNRVIVDANTGEVVAIQPPQTRLDRRALRRQQARQFGQEPAGEDRYYLDDPEDMARLRQRQLEEEGRVIAPPVDNYDPYDQGVFPDAPGNDGYPGATEREQPRVTSQPPVERRPLEEASIQPAQPEEGLTESAVPNASAPNVSGKVDSSLSIGAREEVAALQVLLDRAGASPGVIDGRFGSNVDKSLAAYREITGNYLKSTDSVGITEALANSGGDAFASYTITPEDAAGPYVASIPEDYSQKAQLERMAYTSVTEAIAERFHMDENYLKAINPGLNFNRPGTIIKVANFGKLVNKPVARILADKAKKQVRAYGADGKLVAAYPATIGSTDTPSPSGIHAISRIAVNPNYTYNPNLNFKQGNNDKVLTIPPGPNGPVGSIWIALDKPTYGIHGTPEPSKIGKTESHGCIRLTNWDATELAKLVKPGVTVEFVD